MTVCRYFLQGNCRYGARCRYAHVYPNYPYGSGSGGGGGGPSGGYRSGSSNVGYGGSHGYGGGYSSGGSGSSGGHPGDRGGTSILRLKTSGQGLLQQNGSIFGAAPNQYAPPPSGFFSQNVATSRPDVHQERSALQHDPREVLQLVMQDTIASEQGGQWSLSCFAPLKGQGCIPGFTDHSPEEIRWCMYQARQMGKLEECKMRIKELYERARMCRQQIVNPNRDVLQIIERLARGEQLETTPVIPVYDMQNEQTPSGAFGTIAGSGILNTPPVSSAFTFTLDNKPQQHANQNFSIFGGAQQGTNAFSTSVFGDASNTSMQSSGQNIFGGSCQPSTVMQSTDSLRNVFGGGGGVGGEVESMSESMIYTPMEELTEEMIAAYKAPTFTMGSVPVKPPPKELCS